MIGWVQITLAVVGLVREILRYLEDQDAERRERTQITHEFRRAIKTARKTRDTSEMERAFRRFGFGISDDSGNVVRDTPKTPSLPEPLDSQDLGY